jgi:CBS domain-containing protein
MHHAQSIVTKRVSDIMSTKLETIRTSHSAKEAAKKMLDKNVSSLARKDRSSSANSRL